MIKKYNIIYYSHYPWSNIMSRYTNLAFALSNNKYVNKLVFLEPLKHIGDISTIGQVINQFPGIGRYRQTKNFPFSINTAISPVPFTRSLKLAKAVENLWEEFTIKHLMKLIPSENRILFFQGPSDFTLKMVKQLKKQGFLTIFDWGDLYEKHASSKLVQKRIAKTCRDIASIADIVLCVSSRIQKIAISVNDNSFIFQNATWESMIHQNLPSSRLTEKNLKEPLICYYGLINPIKLDYDLIREVSRQRLAWKFIFIGPQNDPLNTKNSFKGENIILMPPMDGYTLHKYIKKNSNLCFFPYNLNDEATYAGSSLKLYESLADGLPIVSTDTFDPGDARELISLGHSAAELISAMEYELETDCLEKRRQRIEYVSKHTWEKRVEELFKIIESCSHKF